MLGRVRMRAAAVAPSECRRAGDADDEAVEVECDTADNDVITSAADTDAFRRTAECDDIINVEVATQRKENTSALKEGSKQA